MFLSNFALRRPVAAICLIIGLAALGINSLRKLPVELLPKLDALFVTVVTVWPGATPPDIEKDVAKRIEDAVATVDGIKHITSSCMDNTCQTLIELRQGEDTNIAAADIREKLDTIIADLPRDAERPIVLKLNVNAKPVITMALTGDAPLDDLYDCADNALRDRLSAIPGVASIDLVGGATREVHVLLDRSSLSAAGLTSIDVVSAVQNGITTMPAGRVTQVGREYAVRFDADYATVPAIASLEVANRSGIRRYISDLGKVEMASKEQRQASFLDGKPCITIRLVKKAETNAVQVVSAVRNQLTDISRTLPGGMRLVWVSDDGSFIKSSEDAAMIDVWLGVLLTAAVLLTFLLRLKVTLIAAITMPLTVVISMWFISMCGFSLNLSTLLAIGLSVGILVTDTIIVLESITSHYGPGVTVWEAARAGASAVAVRGVASTLTHVVVLLPIGMMTSAVGTFFRPFAVTTLIVNVVSFFISFTLTPVLSALLLKRADAAADDTSLAHRWEDAVARVGRGYANALATVASRRAVAIAVVSAALLLFVHSIVLAPSLGTAFVPDVDKGEIVVKFEYPTYYSLTNTMSRVREVERSLRGIPNLQHMLTMVGKVEGMVGQTPEGVHLAQVLLEFPSKSNRIETIFAVLADVRQRLAGQTDCIITASIPDIVMGQNVPIDLEVSGDDFAVLNTLAKRVRKFALEEPGFVEPDAMVRDDKPEILVRPRRALLSDMSVPVTALASMTRANLEGIEAGSFRRGARTYKIRVKLAEMEGVSQVQGFQIPTSNGSPVVLANFADVQRSSTPIMLTRVDRRRVVKFYSNLAPTLPLGNAVAILSTAIDQKGDFPAGYGYRFGGMYEVLGESAADFLEAGMLAIGLTYLVLAGILGSFLRPLLIMGTIPLAFIGVVWALYLTHTSISIFVLLGFVLLIGIVVTTAVLILDRVRVHEAGGLSSAQAMIQAAQDEFRPIALVTLAAILGMLPLALGSGLGNELRAGIGIAAVGGIAISAALSLIVLPIVFMLFARRNAV